MADIDDLKWRGGVGQADVLVSCSDVCDKLILQAAAAYGCRQIFTVMSMSRPMSMEHGLSGSMGIGRLMFDTGSRI